MAAQESTKQDEKNGKLVSSRSRENNTDEYTKFSAEHSRSSPKAKVSPKTVTAVATPRKTTVQEETTPSQRPSHTASFSPSMGMIHPVSEVESRRYHTSFIESERTEPPNEVLCMLLPDRLIKDIADSFAS